MQSVEIKKNVKKTERFRSVYNSNWWWIVVYGRIYVHWEHFFFICYRRSNCVYCSRLFAMNFIALFDSLYFKCFVYRKCSVHKTRTISKTKKWSQNLLSFSVYAFMFVCMCVYAIGEQSASMVYILYPCLFRLYCYIEIQP